MEQSRKNCTITVVALAAFLLLTNFLVGPVATDAELQRREETLRWDTNNKKNDWTSGLAAHTAVLAAAGFPLLEGETLLEYHVRQGSAMRDFAAVDKRHKDRQHTFSNSAAGKLKKQVDALVPEIAYNREAQSSVAWRAFLYECNSAERAPFAAVALWMAVHPNAPVPFNSILSPTALRLNSAVLALDDERVTTRFFAVVAAVCISFDNTERNKLELQVLPSLPSPNRFFF
jgi:hypothetical protein